MYDRFGTKMVQVETADTIIAEGEAVVDALGLYPALARPICVELADGADYDVFDAGDMAKSDACSKELTFYCTDNRDGRAQLAVKEGSSRDASRPETKAALAIPISAKLPKPYDHERVKAQFAVDDDLILRVSAKGSILPEGARTEIFDLHFALRSYGGVHEAY